MTTTASTFGRTLGLAYLARVAVDPQRVQSVWDGLVARITDDPSDAGAALDLSTLLLATGNREQGLAVQAAAIGDQPRYRRAVEGEPSLRLLAFMTRGDFTANTPLDFMLEGSRVELLTHYIDGPPDLAAAPDHDIAFFAIGQSEEATALLLGLEGAFEGWPRPVMNNHPRLIADMTRDGVAAHFAGHAEVFCPATVRASRASLLRVADGRPIGALAAGLAFPAIIRPLGTHAGIGLERVADAAELAAYLSSHPEDEFYVSTFVDYSGRDGLFRKLRIVFIDGRPHLSHMAVSRRWMVHYLNADMAESAENRQEEAQMMASFDAFVARHAEAFAALNAAFPMDYYGIDCAEAPDGRLLVFEVDVAMIVHDMDPVEIYPYKKPAMARLFAAFVEHLEQGRPTALRRRAAS